GAQWPNVDHVQVASPAIQIGTPVTVTFHHQDRGSGATIYWYLDSDTNPYNGLGLPLGSPQSAAATGNEILREESTLPTVSVPAAATYRLCAKIVANGGGPTRYVYGPQPLVFSVGPPVATTPTITSVAPTTLPGLPLPQTQLLTITGTGL